MVCRYAVCVFMYKDAIQLNVNRGKSDSIEMKSFTDFLLKFLHNKCLKGKATDTHTHWYTPYTDTPLHTKYDTFFGIVFGYFVYAYKWSASESKHKNTEVEEVA